MMAEALMEDPALMRRANRSHTFALQYRQKETAYEKQTNESATLNRVKRDRSMIIRADKLVDGDGKKANIVTMVNHLINLRCDFLNLKTFFRTANEKLPNV
jgi:hypothetical protein